MKLSEILKPECMVVPLEVVTKNDAIKALCARLAELGRCQDEERLLQAVFERESLRSTGIGKGLAVPHGKTDSCVQLVMALGKPSQPIEFQSLDGEPAEIVVLLASPPDQNGPHIQALARISRLMMLDAFRRGLADASSAEAIYTLIQEHES